MQPDKRNSWVGERFGEIEEDILGNIEDVKDMTWPQLVENHFIHGRRIVLRKIENIESEAERVAEIYRNGIDEMVENGEYEWHHDPQAIIERVQSGEWNFYGAYLDGTLVEVLSFHIVRGQRTMHWIWGCVDPAYRGLGIIKNLSKYYDKSHSLEGKLSPPFRFFPSNCIARKQ